MTESKRVLLLLAAVLVTGIASGAGGMYVLGPQRETTYTWLYRSDNIAIDQAGKSVIGGHYDRETEAIKLIEAFMRLKEGLAEPVCRLVDNHPISDGQIKVPPGILLPRRWRGPDAEQKS